MKLDSLFMRHYPSPSPQPWRAFFFASSLVVTLLLLTSCVDVDLPLADAITEIERVRQTVATESTGWRDELPRLVDSLSGIENQASKHLFGIESQASRDAKGVIADATNQVRDLATQSILLGDAKAQDLVAQAGVEFRCNADFVKAGVSAQLQYLSDDLKFWKLYKRHLDQKPIHAVCWINPTSMALYPSGNDWLIDTSNMSEKNIVHVFGYNFRSDAMPTLELRDANGAKLRDVAVRPTYITHYQINLDFSAERFPELRQGMVVEFRWPDQPDPNHINLTTMAPAKLRISDPVFTPAKPVVQKDAVNLQVTVTNEGSLRSGSVVITWKPDPNDRQVLSITLGPLEVQQSRNVTFPGYVYQREGTVDTEVSLDNGDHTLHEAVTVRPSIALDSRRSKQLKGGGGDGGDPNEIACPTNGVVTGLIVESAQYVEKIQLTCSQLLNDGTNGTSTIFGAMGGLGDSAGAVTTLACRPNQVLMGIRGRSGEYVDQIQGHCASLTGPQVSDSTVVGGGGGLPFDSQCPANHVVTGIVGRSGWYLDQVNIVCTPIVRN
jgi:hypothetical protein